MRAAAAALLSALAFAGCGDVQRTPPTPGLPGPLSEFIDDVKCERSREDAKFSGRADSATPVVPCHTSRMGNSNRRSPK